MYNTVHHILQWLNANPHLAGIATFVISAAESVAIVGTIIPGTIMMTAIGTLAGAGVIPLWSTILWAILGAIVGDGISYWFGHYFKDRLFNMWPFTSYPELLISGQKFFHKHGAMSVFIGRFVGPVRALVPLIAGMLGLKPLKFFIANVLSAIGWAPAYMLPGILLGAASLELPPDIAVHAILMVFLTTLFIILCIWLLWKLFKLTGKQIDAFLNWVWNHLQRSKHFAFITSALKHHDPAKTHGQLVLAFYLILTVAVFIYLCTQIFIYGPQNILINHIVFYFLRSIRTPFLDHLMVGIAFLGEYLVFIPVMGIVIASLLLNRNIRTAMHVFTLGMLSVISVEFFKTRMHITRPLGIYLQKFTYAFPSGHAVLSTVLFFGICLLMIEGFKLKKRWPIFTIAGLIVLAIGVSRVYLGTHWFTDVIGGYLLGASLLMLITISFNRGEDKPLKIKSLLLITLIAYILAYSVLFHRSFKIFRLNHSQVSWPTKTLVLSDWWNNSLDTVPIFRTNRVGLKSEVFDLQWLGNLEEIKQILLENGWKNPPKRNWINVLERISDIQSSKQLPLVSPIHLDSGPALVLIKTSELKTKANNKARETLLVLRLWDSRIIFKGVHQPFWLGSIKLVSGTYSWLFRENTPRSNVNAAFLFQKSPQNYDIKQIKFSIHHVKNKKTIRDQNIILIKPKNI